MTLVGANQISVPPDAFLDAMNPENHIVHQSSSISKLSSWMDRENRMRIILRVLVAALGVSGLIGFASSSSLHAGTPRVAPFPKPTLDEHIATSKGHKESAVLSGGCFWGVQAVFQHTKGVISATSGYAGGEASAAHYEQVSVGNTGHAESVQIIYDPSQVTYGELLMIFFSVAHNPTELNKQGPDWGTQYRSSIFYSDEEQEKNCQGLRRTTGFSKSLRAKNRDATDSAKGILSRRSISPGLRHASSR